MGSNTWNPGEWPSIVDDIRSGDPVVGARLASRERLHDNMFQQIVKSDFTPEILQDVSSLTYTDYRLEGYRIGNFVHLSFRAVVTNSPAAVGDVTVSLPPYFPIILGAGIGVDAYPVLGSFAIYDSSTATLYHGLAVNSSNLVTGWANGQTSFMGSASPNVSLAINDHIAYSLSYITSVEV